MHEEDPGDVLREAYRHVPDRAEPSPFLWRRTRGALVQRGLLQERATSWRRLLAAGLLAAGVAGFAVGWATARSTVQQPLPPAATSAGASDPLAAAQLVQQTGTAHALALEALVRSLERARPEELAVGQQVTLAAARAQAAVLRRLVSPEIEGASTLPSTRPVIWF